MACDIGEVDRGGVGDALLAACQGEQAVDEPLVAPVDGEQGAAEQTE